MQTYPVSDDARVKNYLNVCNLTKGELAALKSLDHLSRVIPIYLGFGKSYSVMEVIQKFEEISGRHIAYQVGVLQAGDVASCYADPSKAIKILG